MARKIVDETLKFNIIINGDEAKKEYGQLERANRKLIKANEDLESQAKKLEKANKQNTQEYQQLRSEIDKNNSALTQNKSRMNDLTEEIGINNLTMRQLRKEYGRLNGILNNMDPNSPKWKEYNEQLKAVKVRMSELRSEMKVTEETMGENLGVLEQFGAGFGQLLTSLRSGDYNAASAGMQAIGSSIKGATKAAWAFIATPIGAVIATLAGIGFIAKEWFNYNNNVKESVILTEQITQLQGEQAEAIRQRNEALKNTFGTDEKEQLETARNLVQQFGISYEEAFDQIEAGLVRGQKNNNEFFDSLREYPTFFAQAQYSVSEFRNIVEAGYNLGIYNDKLPDAIKEFNISIQEQTKATRDALVNAFGQTFTDDLLERVNSGKTSTKDALQEVSQEAERLGLSIEQNQRLTADVFRGAGEDAGGAQKIFQAMTVAAETANRALTPLEQSTLDLAQANRRLEEAQSAALKSENFVSFSRDLEVFWIDVKTQFFNGVDFITNVFTKSQDFLISKIVSTVTTARRLPEILKSGVQNVATSVIETIKSLGGLGDVLGKLLKFDFAGAKTSAIEFKENFKSAFADVKSSASDTIKEIIATQKASQELALEQLQSRREGNVASVNEGLKTQLNTLQEINNEIKKLEAIQNNSTSKSEFDSIQKQIDELILKRNKITGSNNTFGAGPEADTQKEVDAAIKKKEAVQAAIDKFDEEQAIRDQLKQVEKDQREEEERVIRKELKFERLIAEADGDTELLAQLETAKLNEIQAIRDEFAERRLEKEKSQKEKLLELEANLKEQSLQAEQNFQNAKRNLLLSGLGTLQNVFGQESAIGKALFLFQKGKAIQEVIQAQAAANAKITSGLVSANAAALAASPLTAGQPFISINTATAAKNTLANNINAAAQIATIAGSVLTGFEEGLYPVTRKQDGKKFKAGISTNTATRLVNDPTILVGERPEMIIDPNTLKAMDPKIVDYILQLAGKRPLEGFERGDFSKQQQSSVSSNSSAENTNNIMLSQAINNLVSTIENGIYAKIFYTLEDEVNRKEIEDKLNAIKTASQN